MVFESGKSGNPGGRPKQPKWAKLAYWFETLQNDLKDDQLKIRDKAYIKLECIKLIMNRKTATGSPTESASNAKDALKLLKALEGPKNATNPSPAIDSSTDSVAHRRPDVQALKDPKIDEGGLGSEQESQ